MDWRLYIPIVFILWLIAMLYVGPSYFTRLRQFINRLESHHEAVFDRLGRPGLSLTALRTRNSWSTVWFVARKEYRRLDDDEIVRIGDAVWLRLMLWVGGFAYIVIALPIMATYQPY